MVAPPRQSPWSRKVPPSTPGLPRSTARTFRRPTSEARSVGRLGFTRATIPDIGAFEESSSYLVTTTAGGLDVGTIETAVELGRSQREHQSRPIPLRRPPIPSNSTRLARSQNRSNSGRHRRARPQQHNDSRGDRWFQHRRADAQLRPTGLVCSRSIAARRPTSTA